MQKLLVLVSVFMISVYTYARQNAPAPLEQNSNTIFWWKIASVIIGLGLGILAYLLIKKNPRKDAN